MDQSAEHLREISSTLYKYHLDNFLCDVFVVTPDGNEVPAHSIVLSAVSIKLRAAFEKSDNSVKKNYIFKLYVTDCDVPTVEIVLQFVYTGAINLPHDMPFDITRILSAGQKLGLDSTKLASCLSALLCLADSSVMENLPPVILTDEDLCLEIVEKGDTPAVIKSQHKARAIEIIKIKSKHSGIWAAHNNGLDHSYNSLVIPRKRGRPPKNPAVHSTTATMSVPPIDTTSSGIVAVNDMSVSEDAFSTLAAIVAADVDSSIDNIPKSLWKVSTECNDQQLLLPSTSVDEDNQSGQVYEEYRAMFAQGSELDRVTEAVIKNEGVLADDDENFLHSMLLKNVMGEEQIAISTSTSAELVEKRKRGRKPAEIREQVIHICEFKDCGKAFRRLREYINHYRTHTGEKPYVCDICGKAFIRSYAVTEHRRTHTGEKPYQCDICGKQFSVGGDLTKHKRLHAGEVLYKCKLCGKEMNTGRENADHRRMHEGGIFCPHCGKAFTRLHNMKEHVRIAHTGDKNYICRDCGKQFAYARNLRYHRRLHKTERPFKCELCGKCFAGAGELGRHERTAHKVHNDIQIVYIPQTVEMQ